MEKVLFDYAKLKGRITEKCEKQKNFASLMRISEGTLISKLSGNTCFSQKEIWRAMGILDIDPAEICTYFFTAKVQ